MRLRKSKRKEIKYGGGGTETSIKRKSGLHKFIKYVEM